MSFKNIKNYISKFSILILVTLLYYLNTIDSRYQSLNHPILANTNEQETAFHQRLLPIIQNVNADILQRRKYILALHKEFLLTHQLSLSDLKALNSTYLIIHHFDPYRNDSWQELINKLDIVPPPVILDHIMKQQLLVNHKNDYNLFKLKCYESICFTDTQIKGIGRAIASKDIIYAHRLFAVLPDEPAQFIHYFSFQEAILDYLWTINTHPAFASYRSLRAQYRLKHLDIATWDKLKIYELTNLNRMNALVYY